MLAEKSRRTVEAAKTFRGWDEATFPAASDIQGRRRVDSGERRLDAVRLSLADAVMPDMSGRALGRAS
jgi:hypothetical protein